LPNLGQFRTRVSSKIGLDNDLGSNEQLLVDGWVNEGRDEVLSELKCYLVADTIELEAGTGDYTLDESILAIGQIYVASGGVDYTFEEVGPMELVNCRLNSDSLSPSRRYALNGANLLMVAPVPDVADVLHLYKVPRPATMSDAAHDPSDAEFGGVPREYHKLIEFYALWQAADFGDDESSKFGETYRQNYEQLLVRKKRQLRLKGRRRLPRVTIGPVRSSFGPNDLDRKS
jgi:hypothetical protein